MLDLYFRKLMLTEDLRQHALAHITSLLHTSKLYRCMCLLDNEFVPISEEGPYFLKLRRYMQIVLPLLAAK